MCEKITVYSEDNVILFSQEKWRNEREKQIIFFSLYTQIKLGV